MLGDMPVPEVETEANERRKKKTLDKCSRQEYND